MALRVVRVGAGSSIQDAGRFGYGRFGVPRSGAFDLESLSLANGLLNNESYAPALEISFAGLSLVNEGSALTIAVVGAPCKVLINGEERSSQARLDLTPGAELQITHVRAARVYIALSGGVRVEPVLGSCSGIALGNSSAGFYGSVSLCEAVTETLIPAASLDSLPSSLQARALRFIAGPQSSSFDLVAFQDTTFMVSVQSDRRGLRLKGACIGSSEEISSQPVCSGALQVTSSGMPILLGPDGPTVGGYPVIGCVISEDMNRVGQLVPGNEVRFVQVGESA